MSLILQGLGVNDSVIEGNIQDASTKFKTSLAAQTTPVPTNASANKLAPTVTQTAAQPALTSAKQVLDSQTGWNENVLNTLQQSSYKIRFFMSEDAPLLSASSATYANFMTKLNARQQTTIAATGVTGINILSLNMVTLTAPNKATRSMNATRMTMVLKEQMGVNLMDQMMQSAKELKIRNFAKTPYFIELSFHGYDVDGQIVANACATDQFQNGGVWTYQVGIQNITSELDDTGAKYTLDLIPYQETLYEETNLRLPEAINVTGRTVGEMLQNVANQLNKSIVNAYGFQTNMYKFQLYGVEGRDKRKVDLNTATLTPAQEKFAHKRSYSMDPADLDSKVIKAHFNRGMAISDVVELILANSNAVTQIGMDVTTTEEINGQAKQDPRASVRECVVFRTECTADFQGDADGQKSYDFSNENYMMTYTLHVLPYYTQAPILAHQDIVTSNDPKIQAQNALNLRQRNYLAKRYDYLYTGMNSEITHLDIKFNLKWQSALPRLLGSGTSQESMTPNDKANPDARDVQALQQKALSDANEILRKRDDQRYALDQTEREAKQLDATNQKQAAADLRAKNDEARSKFANDAEGEAAYQAAQQTQTILVKALGEARDKVQTDRLKQYNQLQKRSENHKFGEDVLSTAAAMTNNIPISFVQDSADTRFRVSGAMDDYYTNDRSVFGAVLNQLYGTMTDGMQKISLDIRGDPYWLGASNLERNYRLTKMPDASVIRVTEPNDSGDLGRPDYSKGDVLFLLTFKYPQGYDESGAPILKNNDLYNGVYYTRQITHKFENGVFSQRLEANKMPLIDVYKAFGYQDAQEVADQKAAAAKVAATQQAKNAGKTS